jgi:uncharacterized protein YrrD
MLLSLKKIRTYRIAAIDGDFGKVEDFLFDDQNWNLRYVVVDTGTWLPGRRVLLAPAAITDVRPGPTELEVRLTKEQVEGSPSLSEDEPVSRQHEQELSEHYGWPYIGGGMGLAAAAVGRTVPPESSSEASVAPEEPERPDDLEWDPNLRSMNELLGYDIEATDGAIGSIDDFIVDGRSWIIRYAVVDTRKWLPGQKVLVATTWIESISWDRSEVAIDLDKSAIKNSAAYDPAEPVNREMETRLYDYYGRPHYWAD